MIYFILIFILLIILSSKTFIFDSIINGRRIFRVKIYEDENESHTLLDLVLKYDEVLNKISDICDWEFSGYTENASVQRLKFEFFDADLNVFSLTSGGQSRRFAKYLKQKGEPVVTYRLVMEISGTQGGMRVISSRIKKVLTKGIT